MSDENKGPRGGDLSQPYNPSEQAWRTQSFAPPPLADGSHGLHRFPEKVDTAVAGIKNEQPWHRMTAYMLNAGRTNSEIALAAGVSVGHVTHLRSQKWFQELCATIANADGEEIIGALKSYTLEAIEGIAELAANATGERTRLAAYQILLEQAHGKPTQKVVSHDSKNNTYSSPEEEWRALQEELTALNAAKQPSPEIPAEAVK